MSDILRAQIYNNLMIKDTDELLEIWQSGDTAEWSQEVFEMIKEILVKRIGYVPPQSSAAKVLQILSNVERHIDNNELDKASEECELAIELNPNLAIAYNYRGEIYEQMGRREDAITNYQRAIQLDSELEEVWANLLDVEADLEKEFEESLTKQRLDWALEDVYNDDTDKAMQECKLAMSAMPGIAIAYNYLGLVLQTLDQLELAIDAYLKAIQLNPRFYPARENLANARVLWEEAQYLRMTNIVPNEKEDSETNREVDGFVDSETVEGANPIPGWMYLDANAFLLIGWPGHRTRPGRTGYDPLERDFEYAHLQGLIFRRLITRTFRTRNPIYIILMAFVGVVYSLYGILAFTLGNWYGVLTGIISGPYLIIGVALLINVYLSLRLKRSGEHKDNGYTFF
ncbi:MAG TPA: tetratricopeptide repeat protein [Anaerolineales bacterium]